MKKIILLLAILVFSLPAFPSWVWVDGRAVINSATNYQNTKGDFAVSFKDYLPYGTKVIVKYGFFGHRMVYESNDAKTVRLEWDMGGYADSLGVSDYTWTANISVTLHKAGDSHNYEAIRFVFLVVLPDGSSYYDKGTNSNLGFYEAYFPPKEPIVTDYVTGRIIMPNYLNMPVKAVWKN
jgi:hypothetical protein